MGFVGQMSQFGQLGSFGPTISSQPMTSPQTAQVLQQVQQMLDRFPQVVAAGQSASVMSSVEEKTEVWADIQFADEAGDLWHLPFGESQNPYSRRMTEALGLRARVRDELPGGWQT